jgi:hypothetical protein
VNPEQKYKDYLRDIVRTFKDDSIWPPEEQLNQTMFLSLEHRADYPTDSKFRKFVYGQKKFLSMFGIGVESDKNGDLELLMPISMGNHQARRLLLESEKNVWEY